MNTLRKNAFLIALVCCAIGFLLCCWFPNSVYAAIVTIRLKCEDGVAIAFGTHKDFYEYVDSLSNSVLRWQDTNSNDLMTLTDDGNTSDLSVYGDLTLQESALSVPSTGSGLHMEYVTGVGGIIAFSPDWSTAPLSPGYFFGDSFNLYSDTTMTTFANLDAGNLTLHGTYLNGDGTDLYIGATDGQTTIGQSGCTLTVSGALSVAESLTATGTAYFGTDDSVAGAVYCFGNDADAGGQLALLNSANEDDTVNFWAILANGDLEFYADAVARVVLKAASTATQFFGHILCGVDDVTNGWAIFYGDNNVSGGYVLLHNGDNTDTNTNIWRFGTSTIGDLQIGSDTNTDILTVDETNYLVSVTKGLNVTGNTVLNGDLKLDGGDGMLYQAVSTLAVDDTAPDISLNNNWLVPGTWSPGHDITDFTNGRGGQRLLIVGGDSDCNLIDTNTGETGAIRLEGDANWSGAAGNTIQLYRISTYWRELSRN